MDKDKTKYTELDTRIKKLEQRFRDLKDSNNENTNSIEDLYDTFNNFKSNGYDSSLDEDYNPQKVSNNQSSSSLSSSLSESNLALDKQYTHGAITKKDIIDNILAEYNTSSVKITDLKILLEYLTGIYLLDKSLDKSLDNQIDTLSEKHNENKDKIKHSLDYFISLKSEKQAAILASITNTKIQEQAQIPLFTILESPLSGYHKQIAISKLNMLEQMDAADAEYYKLKQWLDNLLAIPFGIFQEPEFIKAPKPADVLSNAKEIMNNAIYGQQNTKDHILEIVARMITNPASRGSVFAVEGAAGVGKTSLIKRGLAPIFGLPFQFISLGGARDMAYLAGENYTYIGSKPGLIVQALKQARCMNPIFYFDELDKVSNTPHGQEIINLLIHITDPAQNEHFQDMYLDGIPIDLSRAVFIFSFNDRALVNPILLDRMEIIKFDKYTYQDKAVIVEKYLLPEIISEYFGSSAINALGSGNALGSSNVLGSSNIKVILKNKKKVLKTLILIPRNQNPRPYITPRKIGKGIIKNTRNKTRGIRCIKRKLEKAIARKNLEELIKPIKQQKQQKQQKTYTIVIKSSDLK